MAAGVRTKIDLSQLDAKPVLRLVPPLPEIEEQAPPSRRPRRRAKARVAKTRVATCTPVIRRRRRVAASVLIGLFAFVAVLGIGALGDAFSGSGVPERVTVVWVEPGETLRDVAERSAPGYDTDAVVARIHELNNIPGREALAGQALQVPYAP
jgi:hypothetical protein